MTQPSRLPLIAICCLCLLALVIAVGAATAAGTASEETEGGGFPAQMIPVDNSSNYLSQTPENVTRESHETAGIDVATSVETDATRLQGSHEQRSLEQALSLSEDGTAERETLELLEAEAERLEASQRSLIAEYSAGEIDARELLGTLVQMDVTAEQYRTLVETVEAEGSTPQELEVRYSNLQAAASLLPSELAGHLDETFRSGAGAPSYVQSGEESLVVATLDGNTMVREALLFDQHAPGEPEQFGAEDRSEIRDAADRAETLYPWVMEQSSPEIVGFGNTSVYHFDTVHPHGEIQSYLDGATTNPFYETQTKNALAVSMSAIEQETENDLRLSVEYDAPTGPMLIDVRQAGDGDADQIDLYVDGSHVGAVGSGGDLWVPQPVGSFEVTAVTDTGDTVSVTVTVV